MLIKLWLNAAGFFISKQVNKSAIRIACQSSGLFPYTFQEGPCEATVIYTLLRSLHRTLKVPFGWSQETAANLLMSLAILHIQKQARRVLWIFASTVKKAREVECLWDITGRQAGCIFLVLVVLERMVEERFAVSSGFLYLCIGDLPLCLFSGKLQLVIDGSYLIDFLFLRFIFSC